jgi:caffeoyl-CoA O-methyltransferase
MFHNIPQPILEQMAYLEAIDGRDRLDGTPRPKRLRQIPSETGKYLAMIAAGAPDGFWLEVGTSAGYSGLWLSLACRLRGCKLTTFEVLPDKAHLARQTFAIAGVSQDIDLVEGDARTLLSSYSPVGFCFLDAEKNVYQDCYDLIVPRMLPGGWLIADNALNHQTELRSFLDFALADRRVDALVLPQGNGLLVCRKV